MNANLNSIFGVVLSQLVFPLRLGFSDSRIRVGLVSLHMHMVLRVRENDVEEWSDIDPGARWTTR
jgi:hypothetical protein